MSGGPADGVMDVFRDLVWDQLVKLAISKIIGLAPFLSWGPVGFIVGKVVTYVAGMLYEELHEAVNFQVIILKHASHHRAFVDSQITLKSIAELKGINSQEFKNAREIHKAALAKFVSTPRA